MYHLFNPIFINSSLYQTQMSLKQFKPFIKVIIIYTSVTASFIRSLATYSLLQYEELHPYGNRTYNQRTTATKSKAEHLKCSKKRKEHKYIQQENLNPEQVNTR